MPTITPLPVYGCSSEPPPCCTKSVRVNSRVVLLSSRSGCEMSMLCTASSAATCSIWSAGIRTISMSPISLVTSTPAASMSATEPSGARRMKLSTMRVPPLLVIRVTSRLCAVAAALPFASLATMPSTRAGRRIMPLSSISPILSRRRKCCVYGESLPPPGVVSVADVTPYAPVAEQSIMAADNRSVVRFIITLIYNLK